MCFLGRVIGNPLPNDLAGVLVTDIQVLMESLENDLSLSQCIEKGTRIQHLLK